MKLYYLQCQRVGANFSIKRRCGYCTSQLALLLVVLAALFIDSSMILINMILILVISGVDELRQIIGTELIDNLQHSSDGQALRACFHALMTCEPSVIKKQLDSLISRLQIASR
jgi:hypothetical protein